MNLLESLQKTQTQRATQPVPGQSAQIQKLLAAKTGKAGTVTGPTRSAVQESQALSDVSQAATAQQQAAQVDVEGQRQAQQAQQQQQRQAQQQLGARSQDTAQQYNQAVTKIGNDLDRLKSDIDSKEGQQALANALFTRRLADQKYTTELNRQGVERRLLNDQDYALEAANTAFAHWQDLFTDEAEFATMMRADDADFQKGLARMNIDAANQILSKNIEANNRVARTEALGSFISSGIQAGTAEYTGDDGKKTSLLGGLIDG